MSLSDLAALGSFLSGLGVLTAIVVALLELHAQRREQLMSAAFEGEIAWSDFNMQTAQDPALAQLAARTFDPEARLQDFSAAEQAQINFIFRAVFHRLEAQWFLSARRGLPPEIWRKRRAFARAYIATPLGSALWARDKAMLNYTEGFVREVESASLGASLPV